MSTNRIAWHHHSTTLVACRTRGKDRYGVPGGMGNL